MVISRRSLRCDMAAQDSGVQGILATAAPPPIPPGQVVAQRFKFSAGGNNDFFWHASIAIPSNDFFVVNGNPTAHDISALLGTTNSISFNVGVPGTVTDAGTEVEDFNTSTANGLFRLPGGQSPNMGVDESSVIAAVAEAYPLSALNFPGGTDLSAFDSNTERCTATELPRSRFYRWSPNRPDWP